MNESRLRYGLYAFVFLGFVASQFRGGCSSSSPINKTTKAVSSQASPTKSVQLKLQGSIPDASPGATTAVVVVHCPDIPLDRSQSVTIKDGKFESTIQIESAGCKNVFLEIQSEGKQTFKKGPFSVNEQAPTIELGPVPLAAAPAPRTSRVSSAEQNPNAIVGNKAAADAYQKGEVLPPTVVGGKPGQSSVPGAALP